jgi:hypothetical protein
MLITSDVTQRIKNNEQIVFVKYGDGEIYCMLGVQGQNCDNDPYTPSLRAGLVKSLIFYIKNKQYYVGQWHHNTTLINPILQVLKLDEPTWAPYHLVMNADKIYEKPYMHDFLKTLQDTNRRKIIVSNNKNIAMKQLFNTDLFVEVPPNNWFINFNEVLNEVKKLVTNDCILLTAAGQGSKVLIATLLEEFSTISCIDIGSSFDYLAQATPTRDRGDHDYKKEYYYYYDILPNELK